MFIKTFSITLLGLSLLTTSACTLKTVRGEEVPPPPPVAEEVVRSPAAEKLWAAPPATDLQLRLRSERLLNLGGSRFKDVRISAHDGVVALEGYVPDHFSRADLVAAVGDLNGVEKVEDRTQVGAPPESEGDREPRGFFMGTTEGDGGSNTLRFTLWALALAVIVGAGVWFWRRPRLRQKTA